MIGNHLEPFKFWCQKVLPNVYDDSLSYYEYLCKLNEYLNDVIGQINTLTDNMEDYEADLTATWLETKEYIDNYFNNLDVQQEINNKLDSMASSGELSTLLAPIVGTQIGDVVAQQIGGTVANQIDSVVAEQIDNSVAGQISTPVSNSVSSWLEEHITPTTPTIDNTLSIADSAADAKKTGELICSAYDSTKRYVVNELALYNGNIYKCIQNILTPEAWNSSHWVQTNGGNNIMKFNNIIEGQNNYVGNYLLKTGKNLIDNNNVVSGFLANGLGDISENNDYATTDFIPIKTGAKITIYPKARVMLAYDNDMKPVWDSYDNSTINTGEPYTYTPLFDGYVRFSVWKYQKDFWQAEYSNSSTSLEDYSLTLNNVVELPIVNKAFSKSVNLFDKTDVSNGWLGSHNEIVASDIYKTTNYIKINKGQKITVSPRARIIGAYDENKSMLIGGYDGTTINTGEPYTYTASHDGYVRFSLWTDDINIWQAEYGDTVTEYTPYNNLVINENNVTIRKNNEQDNEINNLYNITDTIIARENETLPKSKNIINQDNMTSGFLADATGSITQTDAYYTTDYLPITIGEKITVSPKARVVLAYDENKTPVNGTYDNSNTVNTGNPYTYTGVANGYVRFSLFAGDIGNWQAEYSNSPTSYEPYGYTIGENVTIDKLSGKKWAVCGDSFTDGVSNTYFDNGRYIGKRKVYPYYIGMRTGIEVLKFFNSGRTLAYPSDHSFTNCLTCPSNSEYYQNIPSDVDYITIYLGINDSHHENGEGGDGEDPTGIIPLGTINDNTTDTYYGAWNVVLTWLKTNRPFAHIGIIVSNGCDRMAYREAQINVAKKYGVAYIDLNGDQITPAMIRPQNDDIPSAVKTILAQTQAVDYPSNTHPNDNAHEFESWFIEDFLRRI